MTASFAVPGVGHRGFSLIEVLTVIAIAAVLWAAGAAVLRRDADGPSLRAAEAELAGLLTLARTHALRTNRATRLLVELDPATADGGQRVFLLALDPDAGDWEPVGRLHQLSAHAAVASDALLAASSLGTAGEDLESTYHGETNAGWREGASYACGYVHFSPTGTSFGTPQLVLMPARPAPDGWILAEPRRARRLLVRPGGAVSVRSASSPL